MFDSVQVRFKNTKNWQSPFADTRTVPFVDSYLNVLKSVVNDVRTEYFWFFAGFINMETVDINYIPEQHQKSQIHVWYNTHPLGGLNKEGNVFLIPTKAFKNQMHTLKYLRDFKDINYHAHPNLFQNIIEKKYYKLDNPYAKYSESKNHYVWLINKNCEAEVPNFYPSFWEDEKLYTWGANKDIILVPGNRQIKQFYDIGNIVNFDMEYQSAPMDIVFLSYDEPNAEEKFHKLQQKYPRAKWCKGVGMRSLAYITAASMSTTEYFFFVTPKQDIVDSFDFSFQPDRLKNACHYIFSAKNPVNGLEYGHGAVLLYNKRLVMETARPGLDFTLSAPHEYVPILSSVNNFNKTPLMAWRTTFREVLKLLQMKPTVESMYRLRKWNTLGEGENAEYVYLAAKDANEYYKRHKHDIGALKKSFELDWLNEYFKKYQ